jgi:hypothetical protein
MYSATSVLRAIRPGTSRAMHRAQRPTEEPPLQPFPDGLERPFPRLGDGGSPLLPFSDGQSWLLPRLGDGSPPLLPLRDGHRGI